MATITKTIKASGGDYASPAAAATAFNAGTVSGATSGDDIVFNIIENVAYNSTFLITANPSTYASYKLTVDPTVRHNGTYGSGAGLAISTTVAAATGDSVAALNGTVEWLEITITGSGKIATAVNLTASGSAGKTKTVRNNLIHGNGISTAGRVVGIGNASAADGVMSCNIIVTNNLIANWKTSATGAANGVGIGNAPGTSYVANNTIDDIDLTASTTGTVRGIVTANAATRIISNNCVTRIGNNVTGGTRTCFSGNGGSTAGTNNASDDATAFGTGALTSIVRGNNLNDPTNGDYRPLNNSAPIYAAGADLVTTPTGVNLDLTGRDRDSTGDVWSIGAYQLSAGGAVANGITLANPAYSCYKRVAGAATVTVTGTYTGTPTNIEVRVDSGSWATLQSGPTGGAYSGTVSVPAGTRSLSVRFSNDTATTASVSNILVGDVFLVVGQSNADGRLTNAQSYTPSAAQVCAVFDPDDTVWRTLVDPTNRTVSGGTAWPLVATQFAASQSVPCGFICAAEGGTSLSQWTTGSAAAAKWTAAKARVTAAGTGVTAVLWDQGESDVTVGPTSQATYKAGLDWLIGDTQSTYSCPFIVAQVGTEPSTLTAAALDAIRSAQQQSIAGTTGAKQGPVEYYRANQHFSTDAEGGLQAAGWWLAIEAALFSGTNGHGPRVSSAVLSVDRTQVTVAFDRVLKTGLTFGSAAWAVSDNGTPATISSVSYHGSNTSAIVLTLSGAMSGPRDSCTVTFASGNTAAGIVVPKSTDITMPSGSAVQIPAEPFYSQAATETYGGVAAVRPLRQSRNKSLLRM